MVLLEVGYDWDMGGVWIVGDYGRGDSIGSNLGHYKVKFYLIFHFLL